MKIRHVKQERLLSLSQLIVHISFDATQSDLLEMSLNN